MGLFNNSVMMGASGAGAYEIERSLRFNSADDTYLEFTPSSTGNRKVWTFSCWLKRTTLGTNTDYIFSSNSVSGNTGIAALYWYTYDNTDDLATYFDTASSGDPYGRVIDNNRILRDTTAWYHLVWQVDAINTTQKIWVNGEEQTLQSSKNPPNQDYGMNLSGTLMRIGRSGYGSQVFNGYIAEVHYCDGQKYQASDFGETDSITGQWIPKEVSGLTYGTNGCYLNFSDNSDTTAATLGKDYSGNGNNWTPNNFSVAAGTGCDSVEDTPTNNFCTLNSLWTNGTEAAGIPADGNLKWSADNNYALAQGTHSLRHDKYYWEVTITSAPSSVVPQGHGITRGTNAGENSYISYDPSGNVYGLGWWWSGPLKGAVPGGSTDSTNYGTTIATFGINDVIGFASDIPNGTLKFYKGGSLEHTMTGIGDHDWFPTLSGYNGQHCYVNFGQRAFTYTPPTGYKTLCSANLPDPTIKNGKKYFNTVLYTGNGGSSQTITGLDFQPDFTWFKARTTAGADQNHMVFDSVRGVEESLWPNDTWVEEAYSGEGVSAFNSNGVTIGNSGNLNVNNDTYVMWAWKEAATAGFDIVSYEGDASGPRTISHNLGVKPELIICKNRDQAANWMTYHKDIGAEKFVYLNTDAIQMDDAAAWNDTEPTSSVFTVNADQMNNGDGDDIIAYLFASVNGFSKVGSYDGNGNAQGPFVYCGFKPAYILLKRVETTPNAYWNIFDTARNPYNSAATADFKRLLGHLNQDELTNHANYTPPDILSNGFKFKHGRADTNYLNKKFIFVAFAESPFKYANAR